MTKVARVYYSCLFTVLSASGEISLAAMSPIGSSIDSVITRDLVAAFSDTPTSPEAPDTARSAVVAPGGSIIDTAGVPSGVHSEGVSSVHPPTPITDPLQSARAAELSSGPFSIPHPLRRDSMLWIFDRKTLALGSTLAFSIPIVALEYQWWWQQDYKYKPHKFNYENDGWFQNYSLGVDKVGHFYTSYLYFRTFYSLMKWADYSDRTAAWTAFAVPAAHAISVELCDGFSRYGFSSNDLIANFLGIGYAFAQTQVPYLNNFTIKWSYYVTSTADSPSAEHGFAADYTGHTYWVSVNMKGVLPEKLAGYWPKYLNLAVGYGASNVSHGENLGAARHKFSISLDYNLSAISVADDTWSMLIRFVDAFHFPAPGMKVNTGGEVQAKPLLLY